MEAPYELGSWPSWSLPMRNRACGSVNPVRVACRRNLGGTTENVSSAFRPKTWGEKRFLFA